jgi:hypothetical protein
MRLRHALLQARRLSSSLFFLLVHNPCTVALLAD